jgi:hypothetical protein
MTINPLGSGVSRYIDDKDRQFAAVVFQARRPPLDSEWNLISLIELEARAEEVRSRIASGWLMDELNPETSFHTDPTYSNLFFFGRNTTGEVRTVEWANVNGWLIPVTGTQTGAPPLAPDDTDTWNKILLNPPPSSTGGNISDFIFLEVWLATIDVDPASPGVAPGKPQPGYIYRFGNVEGGYSFLPDQLIDPDINAPTTRRVQIQYRIRNISNIGIANYPDGFDQTTVFAQGLLSVPSSVPFTNMRQALGDSGLWRAGTGDPSTFGTVDGYVYAIPICAPFRRNTVGFSDGNLSGAFNRNSAAITRNDATIYTSQIVLPAGGIGLSDTSFTLTSITGTVLASMTNFGESYFRINDELILVTGVIPSGPNFQVNITRGALGTVIETHTAGTVLIPYTVRPDGLYADQVAATDILDLRHSVADKFDYENILRTNTLSLLKGKLRTSWKRFGSTNSSGPVVFYGDRITDGSVAGTGITKLDASDGNRRVFSDSVTIQRFTVPVVVPSNSAALLSNLEIDVAPYNIGVIWNATPPIHVPTTRLSIGGYPTWYNGDQIAIQLSSFYAGLSGDTDQVRFMLPSEDPDAVIINFEGMTTDPNGGNQAILPATIASATNPNLTFPVNPAISNYILKNGKGLTVTVDISGNLLITLNSGAVDAEFQEFIDALQGNTNSVYATNLVMHVEFTVIYGAGRGLSHKPGYIHTVKYNGDLNTTKTMVRDGLVPPLTRMIPTYLGDSPYVQVGNDRQLAKTSEVMIDPGSKTVVVAPYREIQIPQLLCRDGTHENWYGVGPTYQGCMPTLDPTGVTTVHSVVDPLGLFYNGVSSRYVEIPLEYLPKPGLHYTPIVPITTSVFSSGINFLLMAMQGTITNNSFYNINFVSYPGGPGNYIITPITPGEIPFTGSSPNIFGKKCTNNKLTAASGGPFQGIQFPPFLAPARITGIYLRSGNSTTIVSPFDSSRTFVGGGGTATNLLHDSFDGPTFLLDVDTNGDLSFILNSDVIDFSKAPPGTTFSDPNQFLVECVLFGFDRGFLQTNGRIVCAKATGSAHTVALPVDTFTTNSDGSVGVVTVAPLATGGTNNEVTFYYSRTPYQGDVFGSQTAYSDSAYERGPLTLSEAYAIFNNPLGPVNTLTLPNKFGYEVLAATSFTTSLGTGRLSGSVPTPLLTQFDAPNNPLDVAGTRVDLDRRFSVNNTGFEDWATPKFPVIVSSGGPRPSLEPGGLSTIYDNDVHPEFAGCTVNLPMGAYFRDKDFIGKTLYQMRSTSGIGSIPIGALALVPFEASMSKSAEGLSTWEGTEFVCGNVSNTVGVGAEAFIKVDGTSNFNSSTVFKTNRGGAGWSATGPWPGGIISSKFPKSRPNIEAGSIMIGTAYLVRSAPETLGATEVHPGNELQMIVVTQAVPSYYRSTDIVHSANGTNEGFTAIDRFRIAGRPIEKKRGFVNTSGIPTAKPLFNNAIYDNPLFYGSSDIPSVSQKDEILPVLTNGQTIFTLSLRPLDPTCVTLYLNGVKLINGVDFTVSGMTNTTVTYIPSGTNPVLTTVDKMDFWYLLF